MESNPRLNSLGSLGVTVAHEMRDRVSRISISRAQIFGLVAILVISLALYRLIFHPLASIPGPFWARLSGHWRNKRYWRGSWHDDILETHQKYGPVVRIAPNEISVVDQKALKLLYGHGHNAKKSEWYAVWDPPIDHQQFFSARDRKQHSFLRKRVSSAYSMSAILRYEPFIQGCLDTMLSKLHKHAEGGTTVDMAKWTNALAFDIVGELGFGAPLGHLESESDVNDLRKSIFELFFWSANLGHYWGKMLWIANPVTTAVRGLFGYENFLAGLQSWNVKRVRERYDDFHNSGAESKRPDMLSYFLQMKGVKSEKARFVEVLGEAMNLVGAGADTTSIAMRACVQAICSQPDVYARLQQEIDDFYRDNGLTRPITYLETQKLTYVWAVTREAMRLLPSIVFQLLRITPEEGITVGDKFIPAGTSIGMSPMAQNRDRTVWGDDADEFVPERWLESDEKSRYLEANNMTFGGSGPRMCVGKNIALVEVHKFVCQLFHHFDVKIVNKERPWRITSYWFAYQHDFYVTLHPRSNYPLLT